jgi:hypothetical protein
MPARATRRSNAFRFPLFSFFDEQNEVVKIENGYQSPIGRNINIAAHVLFSSNVSPLWLCGCKSNKLLCTITTYSEETELNCISGSTAVSFSRECSAEITNLCVTLSFVVIFAQGAQGEGRRQFF